MAVEAAALNGAMFPKSSKCKLLMSYGVNPSKTLKGAERHNQKLLRL
jgi:hypothetical protein